MTTRFMPLWQEGMAIHPQHMQQWDRAWTTLLDKRFECVAASGWGIRRLAIDESMLALGKVSITMCQAVLPDGSVVDVPGDTDGPLIREIPPGTTERLLKIGLALNAGDRPMPESAGAQPGMARFTPVERQLRDAMAVDRREETIALAMPNLRLVLEGEAEDELATLPIARVKRDEAGAVILNGEWLPPALDCKAHPRYAQIFREVEAMLRGRSDMLALRVDPSQASPDVSSLLDIIMLQTVNRAIQVFASLSAAESVHPELAYRECLRLAGDLSIFTPTRKPAALPAWRHADPTTSFQSAVAVISKSLGTLAEAAATALPMEQRQHGLWLSQIRDRALLMGARQLVLTARAARPPEELRAGLPPQTKIGPLESVRDLVSLQVPGLSLMPLPVAPREIPYQTGTTYFELDRSGDMWRRMNNSVALAVHIGGEWPDLALELWAIRSRPASEASR